MAKVIKGAPKAVTANRLGDGIVVFMKEDGSWSETINDASVAYNDADAEALLKKSEASEITNEIVAPYLFDVEETDGKIVATHMREHMRTLGPSVRQDLGKQAESL